MLSPLDDLNNEIQKIREEFGENTYIIVQKLYGGGYVIESHPDENKFPEKVKFARYSENRVFDWDLEKWLYFTEEGGYLKYILHSMTSEEKLKIAEENNVKQY